MKWLDKHTDIHLRIRTLIAEAGRKFNTRGYTSETIEDETAADSTIQPSYGELEWVFRYAGLPRSHESSRRTINCSTVNCRARSTLSALFRMAVPQVLSSTL